MKSLLPLIVGAAGAMAAGVAVAEVGDFNCDGAQEQIRYLERGPDFVIRQLKRDPERFVHELNDGWHCHPEPLEQPADRNYVVSIDCIRREKVGRDYSIQDAGETFKRNLSAVHDCFEGEILQEAPSQVGSPRVTAESLNLILDRDVRDRKIIVRYEYGLSRDGYIYWATEVGYTVPPQRLRR